MGFTLYGKMKWLSKIVGLFFLLGGVSSIAQSGYKLSGVVKDAETKEPMVDVLVVLDGKGFQCRTNEKGFYVFKNVPKGDYEVVFFMHNYDKQVEKIKLDKHYVLSTSLTSVHVDLEGVTIKEIGKQNQFGIRRLKSVEGTAIYAGKKNDVIVMEHLSANKATNNARQVYAKVAGVNVWESDGAGIQLGIGARGLSPDRTTNFNTRQNGYDISADALGYPESYYTPPVEGLERIEMVRGAASLQYGTQFGGLLNFVMKKGPKNKPIEVVSRQTLGSFGLFTSFNSLGGTKGQWNYYTFYQRKQGKGWRPNSGFEVDMGYANVNYQVNEKLKLGVDLTHMNYLAQQAGGLTDQQFEENPRQSNRERNWFNVNWNLGAFNLDYKISNKTAINSRWFGLLASRKALGHLARIDRADPLLNRDLIWGEFKNWGNETRLIHRYNVLKRQAVFLVGGRYYNGTNISQQGTADDGYGANFSFINDAADKSFYRSPNLNYALFSENVFYLNDKLTLTPGVRYEFIDTRSNGYYNNSVHNLVGDLLEQRTIDENMKRERGILLFGLGASYKPSDCVELYSNYSDNYRSINFSDIRIVVPSFVIDENIEDESGFSFDIGVRGDRCNHFNYDVSGFYLDYDNKIAVVPNAKGKMVRTNVSKSKILGLEAFGELSILKAFSLVNDSSDFDFSIYSNVSLINGTYQESEEAAAEGKKIELVPPITLRSGASFKYKTFGASYQYSYIDQQFTDVTNAIEATADAIAGAIPSYFVMDLALTYRVKFLTIETGVNNLTNNSYFTRRAVGYPGPGIIPSDGRSFYITLQVKL